MILRVLIAVLLSIPIPALGQPLFGDPLAAAAAYRSERGSVPQAAYQVIYEASDRKGRDAATRSERVFVVAVYFIETDGRPVDREAAEGIR